MADPHDASLLRRTAGGDRRAFEEFVRRWEGPLYRFLRRTTGSDAFALEARQVTLLRIYTRAGSYRGGDVPVWLFRTAYRVAANFLRREARASHPPLDAADRVAAASAPPDVLLAEEEERAAVRRALDRLSASDRAVLWLRIAEGFSGAEVARVLDAPPSTLRYRLAGALRALKRNLYETQGNGRHHAPK
jgi:RNA polymerase sigma-70 factor (ECF subfamily)